MKETGLKQHYQTLINEHGETCKRLKSLRFWISLGRFISFGLFGWALISWIIAGSSGMLTFPAIVVFLSLVSYDLKLEQKLRIAQELVRVNEFEMRLLDSDLTDLDKGNEFLDPTHAYCNDLNLFGKGSVFQNINRTTTQEGKTMLASLIKNIPINPSLIKERQLAIKELATHHRWRQTFRATGNLIQESNFKKEDVVSWFRENKRDLHSLKFKATIYLFPIINIILMTLFTFGIIDNWLGGFSMTFVLLLIYSAYNKTINWYNTSLTSFSSSIRKYDVLISSLKDIRFTSKINHELQSSLFEDKINAHKEIKKAKRLLNKLENRNNIIVAIVFNALYLRDLHIIKEIDRWQKRNINLFPRWFGAVATLDALSSLAGFAFNHPNFAMPQLSESILLDAADLGHPLIDETERVNNNISFHKTSFFYVVTGANMAGKSTFLRTVSVNLIMASMGLPVCARHFTYKPVSLFTSIGTSDDLTTHTSYFKAELLRLKALYDQAAQNKPLFVVMDEILTGTNSEDKRKGSLGVLKKLVNHPVYGMVATHDLDLGKLEQEQPASFKNICFEISFKGDKMIFDYKLREGVTQNMNASYLLNQMGLI